MKNQPQNCWEGHKLLETRVKRNKNLGPFEGQTIYGNGLMGGEIDRIEEIKDDKLIVFGNLTTKKSNLQLIKLPTGEFMWCIIDIQKVDVLSDEEVRKKHAISFRSRADETLGPN